MADQNLTELTQMTEAQILSSALLYAVGDPEGTPVDLNVPVGSLLGEYYKIVPSIASNNLTVAITHLDGSDATATNPLLFKIGDTWQTVVASLAVTKNAGTNWCNAGGAELAAQDVDYFVYVIQETGAAAGTKIGFSRICHATTMADFVNTSTDEKYIAGSWTNLTTSDAVTLVGRFRARLSGGAGYTWSIPTAKVINRPIYESDMLVWAAQTAGFASDPVSSTGYYKVRRECMDFYWYMGSVAASDATNFTVTVPFKCKSGIGQFYTIPSVYDNSAQAAAGLAAASSTSNVLTLYKSAYAAWTNTNNKSASFQGTFLF